MFDHEFCFAMQNYVDRISSRGKVDYFISPIGLLEGIMDTWKFKHHAAQKLQVLLLVRLVKCHTDTSKRYDSISRSFG